MSEELAISLRNVSKCFRRYDRPIDRLKELLIPGKSRAQEFWALRDIDLDVPKGQTLGIVGRNGSGKSTLLQIIAGTLTPTTGTVKVNGRVSALLELGSGFNPEFTGRQNIFFNAQVLGLSKAEIEDKFDRIASFADIGEFLEQPVKTYSSGMHVRLAFAVASHVDADVIIVDEALAVGDAIFTQKCMRFIRNFQDYGTLLFVSHDLNSVKNLCNNAMWLNNGQITMSGIARDIAENYLQFTLQETYGNSEELKPIKTNYPSLDISFSQSNIQPDFDQIYYHSNFEIVDNISNSKGWQTGKAKIKSVCLNRLSNNYNFSDVFEGGEAVRLVIFAEAFEALQSPILGFLVRDRLGQDLFGENTFVFTNHSEVSVGSGLTLEGIFEFNLPMLPNGQYVVMASIADGDIYENIQHHWLHDALIINVSSSKVRYGLVGIPFKRVELKVKYE